MPATLRLPRADGSLTSYTLTGQPAITAPAGPIKSRVAFAAVHIVADPRAAINPTLDVALDWDATLSYRRYLYSLGLAVSEAMDTSQRGMGFPWKDAKELIKRAVVDARTIPGAVIASGAGTDDLLPSSKVTLADVEAAYEDSCGYIESVGGRIILMASRALAACAKSPDDYVKVYARILGQVKEPVIIHWLGRFRSRLRGYLARPTSTAPPTRSSHRQRLRGQDRRREDLSGTKRDRRAARFRSPAHVHGDDSTPSTSGHDGDVAQG